MLLRQVGLLRPIPYKATIQVTISCQASTKTRRFQTHTRHALTRMTVPMQTSSTSPPTRHVARLTTMEFVPTPTESHSEPLGPGKTIKTAACLIIGDEILNGKTRDSNSNFAAKFCFESGIELKRIEVVADDEAEIMEAVTRMVEKYDLIITSGGIGPTHDDITYASLAHAFGLPLQHHEETIRRMNETFKGRRSFKHQTKEQVEARDRMALFPSGEDVEVLYTSPQLWVPVVRLKGKICVLPGVPRLFELMMEGLAPYLPVPSGSEKPFRYLVHTSLSESSIAPYLTSLQERVRSEDIRIGSYPQMQRGVTVSLIGKDIQRIKELGQEVVKELHGTIVTNEDDGAVEGSV